jgi:succinate dehydrogenase/fumarate reductase flavoprotein subunit
MSKSDFVSFGWPYPVKYGLEHKVNTDVLILGGGLSGCSAAISAAKSGLKVALIEKGCTAHSGAGGAGIDHWHDATTNPCSKVTPEEYAQALIASLNGYTCGIGRYISCRESYDTLLEIERMGLKIRDTEDEFKGAPFRDEETKLIFAYDYENRYCVTIWGTTLKTALDNECRRLGVDVYDRMTFTSLLTEGAQQGARVTGATGLNIRTGEFFIFKAKATIICTGGESRLWMFSSEHRSLYSSEKPSQIVGEGYVAAWKAGASFSLFEKSVSMNTGGLTGLDIVGYLGGFWDAEWRPCTMVDAKGKEIPWVDRDENILFQISQRSRPAPGQKFFLPHLFVLPSGISAQSKASLKKYGDPHLMRGIRKRIAKGEFVAPIYADLPSMPEHERRAIFGLHIAQEGRTWIGYRMLTRAGFDPGKHMLQFSPVEIMPRWRTFFFDSGGLVPDWDLRTSLEGLYAAGEALLTGTAGAAHACATGRYAGRKAANYALRAKEPEIDRKQVENEKTRVYAPVSREHGIDWKELNIGICQIMQVYCGDVRNEESLMIGLKWLEELKEQEAKTVRARNPHELGRCLESLSLITLAEMVMHASLARKASSAWLGFQRSDYPEVDPSEWHKWITTKLDGGKVKIGELPIDYYEPLKENYEAHCGL